jgi:hypothetical protein
MSSRLDTMIARSEIARGDSLGAVWDADRAARVREGALRGRELRVRRDRFLRRGLVVAGGAGLLVLALLRAAGGAQQEPPAVASAAAPTATAELVASRALADAGYARD